MQTTLAVLLGTAASIGFLHTLLGVDHYLPFVVMGRAQRWPLRRTLAITALCGAGHVLSSVAVGLVGIALGSAIQRLELIEARRGEFASWLLIGFGLAYTCWGIYRSLRGRPHTHPHLHADGTRHVHRHAHDGEHLHPHDAGAKRTMTIWALFVIFILGPCEPLIPLLMVPAFDLHWGAVVLVAGVFGLVTIATMLGMTAAGYVGLQLPAIARIERYAHALAGLTIAGSGFAIRWLGV